MSESVVKSAARVLEVMEFFAARRTAASVSEVCSGLNYPQSSTSVLLKSLLTLGYLSYDTATRCYHPTQRVALIGRWLQLSNPAVGEIAERLQRATSETVLLGQMNGLSIQYIQVLHTAAQDVGPLGAGELRPLIRTASGRVLLAQLPEPHALRILRRANAEATSPAERVDEHELIDALAEVRRTGFALTDSALNNGASAIATLAPIAMGQAPLSIAVAGPSERVRRNRETIMAALREIAPAPGSMEAARPVTPESIPAVTMRVAAA